MIKLVPPRLFGFGAIAGVITCNIDRNKKVSVANQCSARESRTRQDLAHKILPMSICILRGIGTTSNAFV
jgi:hypothetical protein